MAMLLMPPWPLARRRHLRFRLGASPPAPPLPAPRGIVMGFLNLLMLISEPQRNTTSAENETTGS
jgi:hypothetical protein